jgi:hypothetical protein
MTFTKVFIPPVRHVAIAMLLSLRASIVCSLALPL